MPSLSTSPEPPPPPTVGPNAVPAAAAQSAAAKADVPTFEGANEAERLTWALRAYYDDPNRPAITSFEPLVKARLLKSIPVPPPGKKYVIDLKRAEVRLENQ